MNNQEIIENIGKNWWWGYLHTNGHIQAKRYFSQQDVDEADDSPFCQDSFGPFEADDRDDAISILMKAFNLETQANIDFDKGI